MLTLLSLAVALTIAVAIFAMRRARRGPCAHPLRRARGRTSDRNGAAGVALVCAMVATTSHDANAATSTGRVVHVDDGDTLIVKTGSRETKVRLVEIDAPEHDQPYGDRSKQSLIDLCLHQEATIEATNVDEYGRTLAHVRCKGVDANRAQVGAGMAWVYDHYVVDRTLYKVQSAARSARQGLWSDTDPIPPWDWRHERLDSLPPEARPPSPSTPQQCRIKGNINGHGERIYHVPGQTYYDQTVIDTANGERWFCTEAEARAAGWRRAKT
jgi:endonuclease YncB( thermonuclease family)